MNKYFSFAFSLFFVALLFALLSIAGETTRYTENPHYYFLASVATMIAGFVFAIIGFRKSDK